MHNADDAQNARMLLEETALQRALTRHPTSRRFIQPTAVFVVVDGREDVLMFTCESLVDRNAQMRENGVDPDRALFASAYFDPQLGRFAIIANDQKMVGLMKKKLHLE